jgi:hypothetical protein
MSEMGFTIEIDTSLTKEEDTLARELADHFLSILGPDRSWAHSGSRLFGTGGGHASVLKRGTLGLVFGPKDDYQYWGLTGNDLVFRRSSRDKRVFTISRPDILERVDGEPIQLGPCKCGRCETSQQRVRYKTRPDTYTYHTEGIVKG